MSDLAVLAQDLRFEGGVRAQTEAFLAAARELGRDPELIEVAHPALAGKTVTPLRVEAVRQLVEARRLAPRIAAAPEVWVVSTLATYGGAAAWAGRPYSCWIGTSLDDEWRGREAGGARRLAHRVNAPVLRRLERDVLRRASGVYATSAGSRLALAAASGLPVESIGVLPLPVDLERFRPLPDERWVELLRRPTLVFVGRADDPRKNVPLLLEAFRLVRRTLPDARLRLVGRAPSGAVGEGVELVTSPRSVAEHVADAALFVLPSRQEGFGLVAAEALACGVPVLATPCGGPEELLARSGGGRTISTFAAAELACAALELLGDVDTLVAMRRRGRAYVAAEHSPERLRELLAAAFVKCGGG